MIHHLRRMVDGRGGPWGRAFDFAVQFLVILSIISFSLETLPDLTASEALWLYRVEQVTVALFSLEYLLRLVVAPKKKAFVFSFFGMVDLLAILPFFLSLGVDLRSIRIVRLIRLIRLFKLMRYSQAMHRFSRAFVLVKEEMTIFFVFTLFTLYIAAVGIYYFENPVQPEHFKSVFHCLWWAVATLTTVGYGDIIPITLGGRIFTFVILMIGLGVVAVPAGLISAAISQAVREEALNKRENSPIPKEEGE